MALTRGRSLPWISKGNLFLFVFCFLWKVTAFSNCGLESNCWLYMQGGGGLCLCYFPCSTEHKKGYRKVESENNKNQHYRYKCGATSYDTETETTTKTACCKPRINNFAITEEHGTQALSQYRSKNRPIVIGRFTAPHISFVTYLLRSAQDTSVSPRAREYRWYFNSFKLVFGNR